ncbi:MAG: hypothetical protein ED859_09545 [Desulfuromonadales bacterium]|nr:MAG: hypothetical protein ED859_09545 [Desulfuromonadales bacterium]
MKLPALTLLAMAGAVSVLPDAGAGEWQATVSGRNEMVGRAFVDGGSICLDDRIRHELDSMVPRFAALEPDQIVKVEAFSRRGSNREEQVRNSLYLALEAQRYLRTRHGVKLNLFLAAAPDRDPTGRDFVRIVTIPDSFKAVHVSEVGPRQR